MAQCGDSVIFFTAQLLVAENVVAREEGDVLGRMEWRLGCCSYGKAYVIGFERNSHVRYLV